MNKSITCENCGKVFKDSKAGYKAIYYYKAHQSTCITKFRKKQRKFIRDFATNASDYEIHKLYEIMKDMDKYQFKDTQTTEEPEQKRLELDKEKYEERPDSAVSNASSIYEEWRFENNNYIVSDKDIVYDEYENQVGYRQMNDFSNEYELIIE
jgi:hypothetical protein